MDWFSSDLHISHQNIVELRKRNPGCPFDTMEQMDELIYENFSHFAKRDRVYLLGDIAWGRESLEKFFCHLHSQKVEIHWILGNHDKKNCKGVVFPFPVFVGDTEMVKQNKAQNPIFLSHYQHLLWDRSHYGVYHLFGHSHVSTQDRLYSRVFEGLDKSMNVNCEFYNYAPITREEVERVLSDPTRDNIDHYLMKFIKQKRPISQAVVEKFDQLRVALEELHLALEKEFPSGPSDPNTNV